VSHAATVKDDSHRATGRKSRAGMRVRLESCIRNSLSFLSMYCQLQSGLLSGFKRDFSRVAQILWREGMSGIRNRLRCSTAVAMFRETIGAKPWLEQWSYPDAQTLHQLCQHQPEFSLIVDVSDTSPRQLQACIDSIRGQYYQNWELILLVPGRRSDPQAGTDEACVSEELLLDPRISALCHDGRTAMPNAWNLGIEAARGEWVSLLQANVRLTPDALTWLLVTCNRQPDAACLYSDSIQTDRQGRCIATQFRPDFSAEYQLASHFTGSLTVFERRHLMWLEGLRPEFGAAARYDLELRLFEDVGAAGFQHIPRALCQETATPGATASGEAEDRRRAVSEALNRRGICGLVEAMPEVDSAHRIRFTPHAFPRVTLFIATRNAVQLVKTCVDSIHQKTSYPNYNIVIINNASDEPELLSWLSEESQSGRLSVVEYDRPFNHSDMHNRVIKECDSEFAVLVNNDIEITSSGWLEQMVATAQADKTIAAVGGLLLYPDHTVQHAGVLIGYRGIAGHYHRGLNVQKSGYNGRLHCLQEVSACTGALLLLRREAFLDVGGFDAEHLPTSFNDVDLCLRLRRAGYRCIYNPAVQAIHFESKTRRVNPSEEGRYHQKLLTDWGMQLRHDPFHNPNLSLLSDSFRLLRNNTPDVTAVAKSILSAHANPMPTRHPPADRKSRKLQRMGHESAITVQHSETAPGGDT